jgi:hypothetical protein
MPLRVVPERDQVSENSSHSPVKQSCDVLHDDVSRSYLANNSSELSPQSGSLAVESGSGSGDGDVLTREAAADEVDGYAIGSESRSGKSSNVVIDRNVRPVLAENGAAVSVALAECHGSHTGALEA